MVRLGTPLRLLKPKRFGVFEPLGRTEGCSISFHLYSSAVSPPRMMSSYSSVKGTPVRFSRSQ
jgi:hypothetical protein